MCAIIKTRCFYSFTKNLQSKLKKSVHFSWDIYHDTVVIKFSKVNWWTHWVGDRRSFHNSFLSKIKKLLFEPEFFSSTAKKTKQTNKTKQKQKQKKSQKRCKDGSYLKIAWHSKSHKTDIEKENAKLKTRKSQTIKTNIFYFLYRKNYIL